MQASSGPTELPRHIISVTKRPTKTECKYRCKDNYYTITHLFYFELTELSYKFTSMDAVLNKKLNILIRLAAVDGEFVPKEKAFIKSICLRHGVNTNLVDEIIEGPAPIGSLGALSYQTTVEYLSDSLMLMLVDGKVLQSEILFCVDIGVRLGFTKRSIDTLIERIQENMNISIEQIRKLILSLPHPLRP